MIETLLKAALLEKREALSFWRSYLSQNDLQTVDDAAISLFPLVYNNLKEESHPLCKSAYRHTWVSNQTLWAKTVPFLQKLLNSGIEKIALLKGIALILGHYRNFGVRTLGDIDILIPPSKVPLAYFLLTSSGWEPKMGQFDPENPHQLAHCHAMNFTHKEGMNLDLHWSLLPENLPSLDHLVLEAIPPGIHPLSPTHLLFHTCIHGCKKSTAPLIRWAPDALTLLKSPIDFPHLFDLAKRFSFRPTLSYAFSYLSTHLKASIPPLPTKPPLFERLAFYSSLQGHIHLAAFFRARLHKRSFLRYLQQTAHLPYFWTIFPYIPYWILKRLYRFLKKGFLK